MTPHFNIGSHTFHHEPNINYQLNRTYSVFGGDLDEIRDAAARIVTLAVCSRTIVVAPGSRPVDAAVLYTALRLWLGLAVGSSRTAGAAPAGAIPARNPPASAQCRDPTGIRSLAGFPAARA